MMYCELHGCDYIERVLPRGTNKLKYILFYPFTCKHGLSFDPLLTYCKYYSSVNKRNKCQLVVQV